MLTLLNLFQKLGEKQKVGKSVYNKKIDKRIPKKAVYVGRPSPWGSPFPVVTNKRKDGVYIRGLSRQRSVRLFSEYAHKRLINEPSWLDPLKGKPLICFCVPKSCHANILYFLANKLPIQDEKLIRQTDRYEIYECKNYVVPKDIKETRLPKYALDWYEFRCPEKGIILLSSPYYIDIASYEYEFNLKLKNLGG